jgi:hypothetical protein
VSCSGLGLAGSIERTYPTLKSPASFKGLFELSAAPGKPPVAKVQLTRSATFEVLEQRGPWRRIAARAIDWPLPFSFDAWTKSEAKGDSGLGMIGLLNEVKVTHVSTSALKAFVSPGVAAPSVTLPPEVWLRAGKPRSGFVPIQVSGLTGPEQGVLWVSQSELTQRARALSP